MWCATPARLGGLGWPSDRIGLSLMLFGVFTGLGMTLIYPRWERAQGPLKLFQTAGMVSGLACMALPFTAPFSLEVPSLALGSVVAVGAVRTVANSAMFVVASIFTNNSVDPSIRGTYNGLSFTCVAAVRTLSPAVCGWLFGWSIAEPRGWPFDVHLVFIVLGAVWGLATVTAVARFDPSIEKPLGADQADPDQGQGQKRNRSPALVGVR